MVTPFIQFAPEECAWCEGTGKYLNQMCHVCKGNGSVLAAQPAKKCPWCEGRGYEEKTQDRCKICDGAGWAHTYKPGIAS
jgi:DnaJ-class molecular chaperone